MGGGRLKKKKRKRKKQEQQYRKITDGKETIERRQEGERARRRRKREKEEGTGRVLSYIVGLTPIIQIKIRNNNEYMMFVERES